MIGFLDVVAFGIWQLPILLWLQPRLMNVVSSGTGRSVCWLTGCLIVIRLLLRVVWLIRDVPMFGVIVAVVVLAGAAVLVAAADRLSCGSDAASVGWSGTVVTRSWWLAV